MGPRLFAVGLGAIAVALAVPVPAISGAVTPDRAGVEAASSPVPGAELWVNRYNGPTNGYDIARSLGVSPNGKHVFVTGSSKSTTVTDYATVAYNTVNGRQSWVARYNGPGNYSDDAYGLAVSPDGSKVFVTGTSEGGPSTVDYATVAYDVAKGTQLWVARYNGPANSYDSASSVSVSPDGTKVFVTGASVGSTTSGDYATVAYNTADGSRLWVRRYNGPANGSDGASNVQGSSDGTKVFVTGNSSGSTTFGDYATVAYNAANGTQLWVRRYNGPANGDDSPSGLGVSPDGSKVFVTGTSEGGPSAFDYATVAYDAANATQLWVARYNGPANSYDTASSVRVSPDGTKIFVTGASVGSTPSGDYATVAYNAANGIQLWVARYNGLGAAGLSVSPDGTKVFVTGASVGSTSFVDYATVAYNAANGTQLWVARYNGPGNVNDYASSIGVSPRGNKVFVTGYSDASNTNASEDYATVAYRCS